MPENNITPEIDKLKDRYNRLNTLKIQSERDLDHANKELEKLKEQARAEFGTDDWRELNQRLEELEKENVSKRSEYDKLLTEIETRLKTISRDSE
jgi:phage shock protein A